MGLKRGVQ